MFLCVCVCVCLWGVGNKISVPNQVTRKKEVICFTLDYVSINSLDCSQILVEKESTGDVTTGS